MQRIPTGGKVAKRGSALRFKQFANERVEFGQPDVQNVLGVNDGVGPAGRGEASCGFASWVSVPQPLPFAQRLREQPLSL